MKWFLAVVFGYGVALSGAASLDDVLQALPQAVPLLTAAQLAAPGFHSKDGGGTCAVLDAQTGVPFAYRIQVTSKAENDWETGIGWTTPKGSGPRRNDCLLLTFEARCTGPGAAAKGQVKAVFRRAVQPYNHALNATCPVGADWRRFNLPLSPEADMTADGILVALQMGMQVQTLEIRDVRLLNFGATTSWVRLVKLLGAETWSAGTRAVGEALNPSLLWEMAAFARFAPAAAGFAPAGAWTATYAVWTCHGDLFLGNRNLGLLTLSRTPADDGSFSLHVAQSIRLDEGMLNTLSADIHCRPDALSSPTSWTLTSRFFTAEGVPKPELNADEQGQVEAGRVTITTGGAASVLESAAAVTADWCLFDAVQRLDVAASPPSFDLLADLAVLKRDQVLRYRGSAEYHLGDETVVLRRFDQLGHGILPCSYWLAEDGRLVLAIMHSRAYILEPDAEAKFEAYSQAQIARYKRLLRQRAEPEGDD